MVQAGRQVSQVTGKIYLLRIYQVQAWIHGTSWPAGLSGHR